jgi:hypothetical protein
MIKHEQFIIRLATHFIWPWYFSRDSSILQILNADNVQEAARETDGYFIKGGIVTVIKDALLPSGTVIWSKLSPPVPTQTAVSKASHAKTSKHISLKILNQLGCRCYIFARICKPACSQDHCFVLCCRRMCDMQARVSSTMISIWLHAWSAVQCAGDHGNNKMCHSRHFFSLSDLLSLNVVGYI